MSPLIASQLPSKANGLYANRFRSLYIYWNRFYKLKMIHNKEPFAKREGYQEVSFRYRFCSPIERIAQVMEEL